MRWSRRRIVQASVGTLGTLGLAALPAMAAASRNSGRAAGAEPGRVALCVGTAQYRFHSALRTVTQDAWAIGRGLQELGGYELVTGGVLKNPRRAELLDAIYTFIERTRSADSAVVYLSGYAEVRPSDRQLFLLPEEAKIAHPLDLRKEAVGLHDSLLDVLNEVMKDNPNLQLLVMLDTYRATTLDRSFSRDRSETVRLDLPDRTLMSLSAEPHCGALDSFVPGSDLGDYAGAVLDRLFVPNVASVDALTRVRADVVASTNGHQRPVLLSTLHHTAQMLSSELVDGIDVDGLLGTRTVHVDPQDGVTVGCVSGIDDVDGLECRLDESPREVRMDPFRLMSTEVSQGMWDRIIAESTGLPHVRERVPRALRDAELPMVEVSWFEAVRFCNAATAWCNARGADMTPVYRFRRSRGDGAVEVSINPAATGWRLPSEDCWEAAARLSAVGERSPFAGGMRSLRQLCSSANVHPSAAQTRSGCQDRYEALAPVHTFNQGAFFHLTGNVWEWCWDRYAADRSGSGELLARGAHPRVIRGGGWSDDALDARSARRGASSPAERGPGVGLRMARTAAS